MLFTDASLDKLAVHYTGNKQNGGSVLLSKKQIPLDDEIRPKTTEALLQRFSNCHERYAFHHTSSLDYNEVYNFVRDTFQDLDSFYDQSVKLVNHLYQVSMHPKIKPGELYVAYFSNILLDDQPVEAIGLFKAETKAMFADLIPSAEDLDLQLKEGVELTKIDKGCLILNREEAGGYELLIYDANGKGEEALYWKDKFLSVIIRQNEFLQTQGVLTITKNYVTNRLTEEFEMSKPEQIDLLNRSIDYFKTHGSFDKEEFESEVLHHEELINSFRQYDESYRAANAMDPMDNFEISSVAVKKQARVFKSVIKLDRNFHIYVHGDRELIEKGYDDALGKYYYKIYFDQET